MARTANPMRKHWFGKQAPEQATGWYEFYRSVSHSGALDKKTKELVGVAAGVLSRCEHCVRAHVQGAFKAGASKAEVAEAVMMASQTAGSSHLFWTSAYEELLGELEDNEEAPADGQR